MVRKFLSVGFMAVLLAMPLAYARVRGYVRSSGTYVQPHYRSSANSYRFDNYSSRGNYNPFTGSKGYKSWY